LIFYFSIILAVVLNYPYRITPHNRRESTMNIFNKVVIVVMLVFFIIVSFISMANEFTGFFKWSNVALKVFNPEGNINRYISTLALLMVVVICVLLLMLEFHKKKSRIVKVYNVQSGIAMITIDAIAQQVKESVLSVAGLKNLKVDILQKSGGVIIELAVELGQSANIPEKMSEIIKAARDISVNKLNIKVIDTKLTILNLISEDKTTGPGQDKNMQGFNSPGPTFIESQKVIETRTTDGKNFTEIKSPEDADGVIDSE
jgi:hypothetical protein